jgi:S-adenosylmethionine-diacylglycerol 3-amino-3-carboxypropyl transferase
MSGVQTYFSKLNYTLANEDTRLELSLLQPGQRHVLAVAGSGGRVLPLLARKPERLTCVDMVPEQLYLTELRLASVKALTHAEFLGFWGYPPRSFTPAERESAFASLALSDEARIFFADFFEQHRWASILYTGRWERTFIKLSKINRKFVGAAGLGLFDALTVAEQNEYLESRFPHKAWSTVVFLLGNAGTFNALLYKGHFPQKNIPESFYGFYSKVFKHLFRQGLARESFFLQLLFFGQVVFSEGCPIECQPEVFEAAKKAVGETRVSYKRGDLIETAASEKQPIDFLSLSDVPSYFSGELERKFLQRVAPALTKDALVVLRNYLHVPQGLDLTGFETATEEFRREIDAEKVGVYLIDIYRHRGSRE